MDDNRRLTIYFNDGSEMVIDNPINDRIPSGCTNIFQVATMKNDNVTVHFIPLYSIHHITTEELEGQNGAE